jgi:hypothetical protein
MRKTIFLPTLVLAAGMLLAPPVGAQQGDSQNSGGEIFDAGNLGIPTVNADQGLVNNILNTVFLVTGALATIIIIFGGLRYVLAFGSSEKIQQAKQTIIYAVVGLVVSVFAYTIVNFVISNL